MIPRRQKTDDKNFPEFKDQPRSENAVIDFLKGVAQGGRDFGDGYPLRAIDAKDILKLIAQSESVPLTLMLQEEKLKTEILPDRIQCPGCSLDAMATPYLEQDDIAVCQNPDCEVTYIGVSIVSYATEDWVATVDDPPLFPATTFKRGAKRGTKVTSDDPSEFGSKPSRIFGDD